MRLHSSFPQAVAVVKGWTTALAQLPWCAVVPAAPFSGDFIWLQSLSLVLSPDFALRLFELAQSASHSSLPQILALLDYEPLADPWAL